MNPDQLHEDSINALGDRFDTWGNDNAFPIEKMTGFMFQNRTRGLTKREYFAAMAMQGLLANDWQGYAQRDPECDVLAMCAISFADALIEQLNK